MSFRALAYVTSLLFSCLVFALFVTPDQLWSGMLIEEPNHQVRFAGRRSACLFVGLALIMISLRNMPPSEMRANVCRSVAFCFALIAVLGLWELHVNHMAKVDIWGPILVELVFSSAFVYYSFESSEDDHQKRK